MPKSLVLLSCKSWFHLWCVPLALVGAATAWSLERVPYSAEEQPAQAPFFEQVAEGGEITFGPVSSGKMAKKGGVEVSFTAFKSNDGVPLVSYVEGHASAARAIEELQKIIARGTKVIEKGPKLNGNGRKVGERAIVELRPGRGRKIETILVWTDGSLLYHIESSSLRHVLAFEKQFHR